MKSTASAYCNSTVISLHVYLWDNPSRVAWSMVRGVADLVDYAVPGEASVVDDDVDLSVAELGRPLDEVSDVGVVEQVARHSEGAAAAGIDLARDVCGFCCSLLAQLFECLSWRRRQMTAHRHRYR